MTRYEITFRVQVWAETPSQAVEAATWIVVGQKAPPPEALDVLPTARLTGEPRIAEGPGWSCLLEVAEDD